MNKGFTLIELLVVVLIIGILAAVALPQYTKAVERSRMAEAVQRLGDLATAQSIWYMQHRTFASSTDILNGDITLGTSLDTGSYEFPAFNATTTGTASISMTAKRSNGMYKNGVLTITVEPSGAITRTCTTNAGSATNKFCTVANAMGYSGDPALPTT